MAHADDSSLASFMRSRRPELRVYIKNVPSHISVRALTAALEAAGDVRFVEKLVRLPSSTAAGDAAEAEVEPEYTDWLLICKTKAEAKRLVKAWNGSHILGGALPLRVRRGKPTDAVHVGSSEWLGLNDSIRMMNAYAPLRWSTSVETLRCSRDAPQTEEQAVTASNASFAAYAQSVGLFAVLKTTIPSNGEDLLAADPVGTEISEPPAATGEAPAVVPENVGADGEAAAAMEVDAPATNDTTVIVRPQGWRDAIDTFAVAPRTGLGSAGLRMTAARTLVGRAQSAPGKRSTHEQENGWAGPCLHVSRRITIYNSAFGDEVDVSGAGGCCCPRYDNFGAGLAAQSAVSNRVITLDDPPVDDCNSTGDDVDDDKCAMCRKDAGVCACCEAPMQPATRQRVQAELFAGAEDDIHRRFPYNAARSLTEDSVRAGAHLHIAADMAFLSACQQIAFHV